MTNNSPAENTVPMAVVRDQARAAVHGLTPTQINALLGRLTATDPDVLLDAAKWVREHTA